MEKYSIKLFFRCFFNKFYFVSPLRSIKIQESRLRYTTHIRTYNSLISAVLKMQIKTVTISYHSKIHH